jgi:peptidylprolyl isomerase
MDRTIVIIFPLALILLGGAWFLWGRQAPPPTTDTPQTEQQGIAVGELNGATNQPVSTNTNQVQNAMQATLHTNKGDIVIEFMGSDAPNTVANFAKLAQAGFYNGTKFHRVIAGFMIQGGDPLSADDSKMAMWGTGGPGYKFADEIHANNQNNIGTISMANAGPNTNGSQFFINVANNNFLDTKHTVFGKVTAGMEVVNAIAASQTGQNDRPVEPIIITSVEVK